MASSPVKARSLANIIAWRLTELPDRGLALLKEFTIISSGKNLEVTVIIRSNAVSLYRVHGNKMPGIDDSIIIFDARNISIQYLSLYFSPRDAAECIAVFHFNRRSLLQVINSEGNNNDYK